MYRKKGRQSVKFQNPPVITASAAIGGAKEGEGPLSGDFDMVLKDDRLGMKTWEAAESKMQLETAKLAISKAKLKSSDIDYALAGDLMNQCVATHYGIRDLNIPFFGLYGACSTMAESLSLGAMLIDGGYAGNIIAMTSSHFCSAEKQFRYPLEYGGQRTPTSQWTVTGCGCAVLSETGSGPRITNVTTGRIVDPGITDINNMGAAMAPAAIDTLAAHFNDTGFKPSHYDAIFTGDLGVVGSEILVEKLKEEGYDISKIHKDCGKMIFDIENQDVHAGGSGCGCMASVFCGHIMKKLKEKRYKRIIIMATGALMNPTVILQGESIPGIAHLVVIENEG